MGIAHTLFQRNALTSEQIIPDSTFLLSNIQTDQLLQDQNTYMYLTQRLKVLQQTAHRQIMVGYSDMRLGYNIKGK